MSTEIILTPETAAKAMGVSKKKIIDWLKSGELKGFTMGKASWRIQEAELRKFAKSKGIDINRDSQ